MVGKVREDGELEAGMSRRFVRAGLWRARLYTEKGARCMRRLRVLTRDGVFMRMSMCVRMRECRRVLVVVHVCMLVLTCT